MKTYAILSCILVCAIHLNAQSQLETVQLVQIPAKYGLVSAIHQPNSPISFEDLALLTDSIGAFPTVRYRLRSRTTKSISTISVEFHQKSRVRKWIPFASSWVETIGDKEGKTILISPGGIFDNIGKRKTQTEPMKKELIEILDPGVGEPRLITFWVGFINRVKFTDGTEFNCGFLGDNLSELLMLDEKW